MVANVSAYDFAALVDSFLASKTIEGRHASFITATIRSRTLILLARSDVRYMPAFKILDLLAALTDIAVAVGQAPQLRANEIEALLRKSLSDDTPLIRQFMLEAALERARYEPLMLQQRLPASTERELILQRRWAAMRAAHQEKAQLPEAWMDAVDSAVERVLTARAFRRFRQGPLLQLFAEMLALARKLNQQGNSLSSLESALGEDGTLWRRYALKHSRYREKPRAPADIRNSEPPFSTIH